MYLLGTIVFQQLPPLLHFGAALAEHLIPRMASPDETVLEFFAGELAFPLTDNEQNIFPKLIFSKLSAPLSRLC
jgi:hypothetical protein